MGQLSYLCQRLGRGVQGQVGMRAIRRLRARSATAASRYEIRRKLEFLARVTSVSVSIDVGQPAYQGADVVVAAPAPGPGNWAGAASCVLVDGTFWLAYRVRRPLDAGRGVNVVVARSADGLRFTPVCEVSREAFGAASFERPVIMPTDRGWRCLLYTSPSPRD